MLSRYGIDGKEFDKEHEDYQEILEVVYDNSLRPLCLCTDPSIPMYIAKVGDPAEYILKKMPNSGSSHHPECESFVIPSELSGRGAVDTHAITEDPSTGSTKLRLDFSLSKNTKNKKAEKGAASEKSAVTTNHPKLSIRSMLHFLYEDASLNKWSPSLKGRVNWELVRKFIYKSACNTDVKNKKLSDILIIPEAFNLDKKDEISSRRKKLINTLNSKGTKKQLGIVIGEVKEIKESAHGYKIVIKHMGDCPLYLDEELHKKIYNRFEFELLLNEEREDAHLITIASVIVRPTGNLGLETLSFMLVDKNWIPFESLDELELIDRVVREKRNFIKGLRYNMPSTDVMASLLLTDTPDKPTAIYLVPVSADEGYDRKLATVLEESEIDSYIWDLRKEEAKKLPKQA